MMTLPTLQSKHSCVVNSLPDRLNGQNENNTGNGTSQQDATISKPKSKDVPKATKRIKILVVDDDSLFNEAFCRLLNTLPSVEIDSCLFGEEAIDKIEKVPYDLVFLDLVFHRQDINGIDVYNAIHARRDDIKVIIMSAHANNELSKRARELSCLAFWDKQSVTYNEMINIVEKLQKAGT